MHDVELKLYHDCLYEIKRRIDVIVSHLCKETTEKYLIIEVETVCLQFRKVLEKIALMSLVANKQVYAEQHDKFAKHYHAGRIMRDLEKVNPNFYPVPIERKKHEGKLDELVIVENGFLTKEEFVEIYEKCGGMLHAQNPFGGEKPLKEIQSCFPDWLEKICLLIKHHQITLVDDRIIVVGLLEREDNGLPQALIFEPIEVDCQRETGIP